MLNNYCVLVLNISYEPIGITTPKSVIKKIVSGNSLLVEEYYPDTYITSNSSKIKVPAVIRIPRYINEIGRASCRERV